MKRLLVACLFALAQLTFAHPKLAPDVPNQGGSTVVDVIVQLTHPPTKDDLKLLGPYGQIKKQWIILNAVHVALTLSQIQSLLSNPDIAYITPNRSSQGALDITTQAVNANLAWNLGWTGSGVGVAVIDSGIAQRPDLTDSTGINSRIVYEQSFVATTALDDYGHGTHVAGIVGSNGDSSTGFGFTRTYKGVAPGANLIDLRVLDQNGSGYDSDVITAIQTAINLKNTYNIRVLNLSLGRPAFESYTLDPLCQAVEAAWQAGIVVVTAAGNYGRNNQYGTRGYGTIASPGNDPYVITVGATNAHHTPYTWDDTVASYSSKGPTAVDHIVKPDIVAPGNAVTSLLASTNCTLYTAYPSTHLSDNMYEVGMPGNLSSTNYFILSGTSMATPVVSGAAAILLQKTPSLTPDQVKERLMRSAAKFLPPYMSAYDFFSGAQFNSQADVFTVGAGYLDVNAALANTDLISGSALSPTVIYNSITHHVTISNLVWGADLDLGVVWGDTAIYGAALFTGAQDNGNNVVWGADLDLGVVWGDSTNAAFNVIWSSSVLWTGSPLAATATDDSDQ